MEGVRSHIEYIESEIKNLKADITIFVKDFKSKSIIVKNDREENEIAPEIVEQNERYILDFEFRDL